METEERFAALVQELAASPDVEVPGESSGRKFGSDALKDEETWRTLTREAMGFVRSRSRANTGGKSEHGH